MGLRGGGRALDRRIRGRTMGQRPTGEGAAQMRDGGGARLTGDRLRLSREGEGSTDLLGCGKGSGCNLGRLRCSPRKTAQESGGSAQAPA